MNANKTDRNRPAEEGRGKDPHLRDYTGQQPGVSTFSTGENDQANQELTETAKDGFNEDKPDQRADRNLDDAEDDEGGRVY